MALMTIVELSISGLSSLRVLAHSVTPHHSEGLCHVNDPQKLISRASCLSQLSGLLPFKRPLLINIFISSTLRVYLVQYFVLERKNLEIPEGCLDHNNWQGTSKANVLMISNAPFYQIFKSSLAKADQNTRIRKDPAFASHDDPKTTSITFYFVSYSVKNNLHVSCFSFSLTKDLSLKSKFISSLNVQAQFPK